MAASILIADDDSRILEMVREYLSGEGYDVQAAGDGARALELFGPGIFHLAILDLSMPGFTGLELLSRFKGMDPDIEVIILTGHAGLESAVSALRLGAYDYLLKPLTQVNDLGTAVHRALEHRRLSQANRTLIAELRTAQELLGGQRRRELELLRQIGEGLASALDLEKIIRLVFELLWDNIPLKILGLELRAWDNLPARRNLRAHPDLSAASRARFETWLQGFLAADRSPADIYLPVLALNTVRGVEVFGVQAGKAQVDELIVTPVLVDQDVIGVLAGGRGTPFTLEEREIFQIIVLQAAAALKNVAYFEQMKFLAIRDALTGLYNQRYFWEVLADEVNRSRRYHSSLSLLFLDLDRFKQVNDNYGHAVGDAVLQQVSQIIQKSIRGSDQFFRYGGEEFAIVLPHTSKKRAAQLAERLRQYLAGHSLDLNGHHIRVTISIGVSALKAKMTPEDLLQRADDSLYRAKQSGRNRVVIG